MSTNAVYANVLLKDGQIIFFHTGRLRQSPFDYYKEFMYAGMDMLRELASKNYQNEFCKLKNTGNAAFKEAAEWYRKFPIHKMYKGFMPYDVMGDMVETIDHTVDTLLNQTFVNSTTTTAEGKSESYTNTSGWISVKDDIPKDNKDVFVVVNDIVRGEPCRHIAVGYYIPAAEHWVVSEVRCMTDEVTHWMPAVPLPEEEA